MKTNLGLKTALIIVVLLAFLYGIFGVPSGVSGSALSASILKRINLGLDLKGGTHLILQVKVNEAVAAEGQQAIERIKADLDASKTPYGAISQPDPQNQPDVIQITGMQPSGRQELQSVLTDKLPNWNLTSGVNNVFTLTLKPQFAQQVKTNAVLQAIETIRNRIDKLGVSEPTIQEHGLGDYQILVELPGVDDPARVKDIIQSTANLEIRQSLGGPYSSESDAANAQKTIPDSIPMKGRSIGGRGEAPAEAWYLISRTPAVSGRDLRAGGAADVGTDQNGRPNVRFHLTSEGGRRFYNFTSSHVGDSLAIVLDNKVEEVATINEGIHDEGVIQGSFTDEQSHDLALVLNSGALPASLAYINENTVGPSLGADSIRHGVMAAVIGMAAVLAFMLIYYRGAGVNADLALILNLVILLGFLGFSGATLTLPGIAGVILTVGMGVDSNVLIFERIREEVRNGKTPAAAVDQGFSHAWITIVDTHVTTIVSAFILFIFGTGPVRGFATTLTFGLLANLFTSVFVSRVIFDALLNRKQVGEALSI
ncbi:MAG: protein translocase subunit SecD [Acidobacteria bacterium]|nr:protein translocase subunit SecD [Acidobacteriota bacterium]